VGVITSTEPVCYRVVLSQLSGAGRGDIGSYNADHYSLLMTLLEEKPMKDGDEWLSTMMRKDRMLGNADHNLLLSSLFVSVWSQRLCALLSNLWSRVTFCNQEGMCDVQLCALWM